MLRKILFYGFIGALIVGVPLLFLSVTHKGAPPASGALIGYTTMLIAFSLVFLAIKRQRDVDQGGVIKFWPAFGLGLGISAVASLGWVIAWEAGLAITHVDFAGNYAALMIEQQKAKGVSGAELAQFVANMEAFKAQYANPFIRIPMTFSEIFPLGLVISLISAALLRNSAFMAAKAKDQTASPQAET